MAGRRIFYYGANAKKFDNKLIKTTQKRAWRLEESWIIYCRP